MSSSDRVFGAEHGTTQLAAALSIAVRIEPELVRAVRLRVLPALDVGHESELWFSDYVSAREPGSIVFDQSVRRPLWDELTEMLEQTSYADPIRSLWDLAYAPVHERLSPAQWVEEYVTWLAVSEGERALPRIEARLEGALQALLDGRRGIADWFAGAYHRLPELIRNTDVATELFNETLPDAVLRIRRNRYQLQLGMFPVTEDTLGLPVPGVTPTTIELRLDADRGNRRIIEVDHSGSIFETVGLGAVQLRTPRGLVYELPS